MLITKRPYTVVTTDYPQTTLGGHGDMTKEEMIKCLNNADRRKEITGTDLVWIDYFTGDMPDFEILEDGDNMYMKIML